MPRTFGRLLLKALRHTHTRFKKFALSGRWFYKLPDGFVPLVYLICEFIKGFSAAKIKRNYERAGDNTVIIWDLLKVSGGLR